MYYITVNLSQGSIFTYSQKKIEPLIRNCLPSLKNKQYRRTQTPNEIEDCKNFNLYQFYRTLADSMAHVNYFNMLLRNDNIPSKTAMSAVKPRTVISCANPSVEL